MTFVGWKISLVGLFVLGCTVGLAIALSGGPPVAHTGDFGEPSCTECHVGNSLNAAGGTLAIAGVPPQYEPGKSYPIQVTISKSGQRRWGFQLAVRAAATGQQAGTIAITDPLRTQILTSAGIQYIEHTSGGNFDGQQQGAWSFSWTAPANPVGDIRFSAAANAANGDFTNASDFIYTQTALSSPASAPPQFSTTLFFPRLITTNGTGGGTDNSQFTGIAIASLDSSDATIRFTAFDRSGEKLSGASVGNPAQIELGKGQQIPVVDVQVFGAGLADQNPVGWFKAESTASKVVGFFLMFNSGLTILDGADVSSKTLNSFTLPEIQDRGFTQIHIANPGSTAASLNLSLMRSDGTQRDAASRSINPGGVLAEFYTDLFPNSAADSSDYIAVSSTAGVVPFEFLGITGKDAEGLNGQDSAAGAAALFSPQYVVGGSDFQTTLSIVNLDNSRGTVTLKFIGDDGAQIGSTRQLPIAANGKIHITDQGLFANAGAVLTQGYLQVTSSGPRLSGSVVFGGAGPRPFTASLPLVSTLQNNLVFGQVASNNTFFTGIALLNPNDAAANATIQVLDKAGNIVRSADTSIPAGRRASKLLTEFFADLVGQDISSGYIRVSVDRGVAGFALFGTNSLSVLSAIPAQVVP